jgi:diguanylate cyclase (GGDEF)-like protein
VWDESAVITDDHRQQTRVGIIGAGHGGQALLEAFAEMPDVRIIGICDIEPDAPGLKQAAAMGGPVYGDAASMLRGGGLDWVFNVSNASTEQRFLLSQELGGARIIDGDVANMVWRILTSFVGEASRGPLRDVSGAQREALFALAWRIIRDFADIGQLSHDNRFGHDIGDKVLRMVGGAIASDCRQGDVAARYGGEEFAIVLPSTDAVQARQIAERLCQKVATEVMRPDGCPQTISIGVATISPSAATGFSPQAQQARLDVRAQLLKHADRAVYEAKGRGRNCVQVVETTILPQGLVALCGEATN